MNVDTAWPGDDPLFATCSNPSLLTLSA